MENNIPAWVAILTAIGGIFGGTFGAWLLNLYQARNKNHLDTSKQRDSQTGCNCAQQL